MEIVVVGAGVFGSWIALLASRAGHSVTLIDRFGPANDRSSSSGESRIIRSAYGPDRIYTVMARRSLSMWTEFFRAHKPLGAAPEETGNVAASGASVVRVSFKEQKCPQLFRQTGVLWIADATDPALLAAQQVFEDLAIEHLWLDSGAIRRKFPEFQVSAGVTALFEPEAGALLADRSVEAVFNAAVSAGTRYETAAIRPPDESAGRLGWVETHTGKRIPGDLFIFAAGSWLPKLFPLLESIIRPTRQELYFFRAPDELQGAPIWIDQSEPCIGYGFPDFGAGMKFGFHTLGPSFDPDCSSREVGQLQISDAARYIERRFHAMRAAEFRSALVCHYENTPSGDFLIDRHPEIENAWFVGGGSGHGFKHGPAIAEYVLSVIQGAMEPEPRFSLAASLGVPRARVL